MNPEQLIDILSLTPTAVAVHIGSDARILFASSAMLDIWGKGDEVIGMSLEQALPELRGQPFIEMFARVWHQGITLSGSDTPADLFIGGKLSRFYFDYEYRAIKNSEGEVVAILHTAIDVTERNVNRDALASAEQNRQLLMREQSLNEELAASNEELNAINEELSASREQLSQMNHELEARVEERVRAFAESEQRFRSMAEHTDVLIAVADETGKKFYFNRAWTELTGRSADELLNRGWFDLIDERDKDSYLEVHEHAFELRVSYTDEFRLRGVDGKIHWMLKKGTPRFYSDGSFAGFISSCIDISYKKESEQRLQEFNEELAASNEELAAVNEELLAANSELERSYGQLAISEERFRHLIAQAPVAICIISANDLMITEVNNGYLELVGKQRSELEGRTIWDAVAEAAEVYAPVMQKVIETGIPFSAREHELILIRKGIPETVFVDFVYEPVTGVSGQVESIMVVGNEVTDKVLARRAIEDVEERVRLAVEAAEIGTYEYNYKTGVVNTSDRFRQIFGFDRAVTREDVLAMYHPDDAGLSAQAHQTASESGKLFYETRFFLSDGSLHWARFHGNVYRDQDGSPERLLGTVLDITAYKELQQQKDDFISIASHELKTPITSLKASLQLLEKMKDNPSPIWGKLVSQSNRSMAKISGLVEDLLNVSKMGLGHMQLNKKKFSVGRLLEDCSQQISPNHTPEILVKGDLSAEVVADEHRIEQVVVNFVGNAIKYAPDGKTILLEVEDLGTSVKVSVSDTGPGIPKEKLPHLFERYFRADQSGAQVSGLGLGLYISAEIIGRHDGEIGVDSVEGKGSTFWFIVPKGH